MPGALYTLDRECPTVSVCVLEINPLAAEHLQRILSKGRQFVVRIIKDVVSAAQLSSQSERCVCVISQASVRSSLPALVEEANRTFPDTGLVFVCELEFWRELQQLTTREHMGFVIYADVAKKLVPTVRRIANGGPSFGFFEDSLIWKKMTRRETEILELVQCRLSNKEIANVLNVAEATVKFHISNILLKAKVDRRRGLLALVDSGYGPSVA
jgi:DNA-binding NarL/FixJ family response regulator